VLAGLVGVAAIVVFMFGQDLFGSDPGTIDDYNRTVLDSCDLPEDSTLLRTYILTVKPSPEDSVRTMSYIWASPLTADEVADFYGAPGPGVWTDVSEDRACRFGQQPRVLVLDRWAEGSGPYDGLTQTAGPEDDVTAEFWGDQDAEITDIAAVPATTRSFLLLRLGQREAEGIFGLEDVAPSKD
jgi:hypothetical protein